MLCNGDFVHSRAVNLTIATTLACAAPLRGQRSSCGPAQQPKDLPTVSFLIDSSGALMELQAAKVLRDSMQFTLLGLPGDSIPVVHALDSTNAMAANVLARSVWPEKPADLWAVRVHVTGGAAPALTLSRATYCPPVLAPGSQPVRVTAQAREERVSSGGGVLRVQGIMQGTAPVPLLCELDITQRGDVNNVKVIRSSGNREVDEHVTRMLVQQKYEPALLDGIPVPSVLRVNSHGEGSVEHETRP